MSIMKSAQQIISLLEQKNLRLQGEIGEYKALASSQQRFVEIIECATDIIAIVDQNTRILYANPAALDLLGYSTIDDVLYRHGREFYSLECVENVLVPGLVKAKQKGIWIGEAELLTKNKKPIVVSQVIIAHKSVDGEIEYFSTILRDITVNKLLEASLRESEENYRTLTSLYPVGIIHFDANGKCVYINDRCSELFGLSLNETRGDGWLKAVHPESIPVVIKEFRQMQNRGVPFKLEYRLMRPNGSVRWVHGEIIAQTNESGEVVSYIGTATDITKLRNFEKQLQEHQMQLERLRRLNTMGEISASIAHQLNQPLTAIVHYTGGILERLKKESISNEIIGAVERVANLAERAGTIVHDLKKFIQKGELKKTIIDINETIINVVNLVSERLDSSGIKLRLNLDQNIPLVEAGRLHIEQVILNITNNAIEALQSLPVKERKIIIITRGHKQKLVKVVINNAGPALNEVQKDQIFEPFYTTKKDGMGMGLAIAQSIMRSHGGVINVDSNQKRGTSFEVLLPCSGNNQVCEI